MSERPQHSLLEDAQGLAFGTFMAAVGITILTQLGLVTGQTAGLAVLISYATGWGFAPVFFLINVPFYALAWVRVGPAFTLKTFVAVAALSAMAALLPAHFVIAELPPLLGAVMFGAISGAGLLALFRHGASLGGIGILAYWLQERTGLRAGLVQLGFDACLFAAALAFLAPGVVLASLAGAVVLNLVIAINHRRDRYIAT